MEAFRAQGGGMRIGSECGVRVYVACRGRPRGVVFVESLCSARSSAKIRHVGHDVRISTVLHADLFGRSLARVSDDANKHTTDAEDSARKYTCEMLPTQNYQRQQQRQPHRSGRPPPTLSRYTITRKFF